MVNNKKEESILIGATELFSKFGYHAVGVDSIVENANVAKMTLYKFFPSKDILIEKTLVRRSLILQQDITDSVSKARSPMGRIKSVFDWHEKWLTSPGFNGCMFIKASEEFPEPDSPIKEASQLHKNWMTAYLIELLNELRIANIHKIAKYIVVVLEGLTVNTNVYSTKKVADLRFSWQCIKQLIEFNQKPMTA